MPVAVLTGRGHPDLVNLGHPGPKLQPTATLSSSAFAISITQREALATSGIIVYTIRDVDELGMATVARRRTDHGTAM